MRLSLRRVLSVASDTIGSPKVHLLTAADFVDVFLDDASPQPLTEDSAAPLSHTRVTEQLHADESKSADGTRKTVADLTVFDMLRASGRGVRARDQLAVGTAAAYGMHYGQCDSDEDFAIDSGFFNSYEVKDEFDTAPVTRSLSSGTRSRSNCLAIKSDADIPDFTTTLTPAIAIIEGITAEEKRLDKSKSGIEDEDFGGSLRGTAATIQSTECKTIGDYVPIPTVVDDAKGLEDTSHSNAYAVVLRLLRAFYEGERERGHGAGSGGRNPLKDSELGGWFWHRLEQWRKRAVSGQLTTDVFDAIHKIMGAFATYGGRQPIDCKKKKHSEDGTDSGVLSRVHLPTDKTEDCDLHMRSAATEKLPVIGPLPSVRRRLRADDHWLKSTVEGNYHGYGHCDSEDFAVDDSEFEYGSLRGTAAVIHSTELISAKSKSGGVITKVTIEADDGDYVAMAKSTKVKGIEKEEIVEDKSDEGKRDEDTTESVASRMRATEVVLGNTEEIFDDSDTDYVKE